MKIELGDDYFLSRTNPMATRDTRDLEAEALEMCKHPLVVRARAGADQRFRILAGDLEVPDEAWRNWEARIDEWTFHYVLLALNSDPNYPRVLSAGYGPPHEWFGRKVTGGRGPGTVENADNNYIFIPVDCFSHFELYGRRFPNGVSDFPIHITSNISQSINVEALDSRDVELDADGSFKITIGPEPANGRANHLQTSLDSHFIFIRDGRVDWDEVPNAYRIRRLDPPTAAPHGWERLAHVAARYIIDDVAMNFFFKQMIGFVERNTLSPIVSSAEVGGMPSQKIMRGRVRIADDECFVFTAGSGDAGYRTVVSYDWWGMSGEYWSHTSTLNNTQSMPDGPDGTTTYVFSIRDPGVHNWVDTQGYHETLFTYRWRLLPPEPGPAGEPWATGKRVKLADLDRELPPGVKRVAPAERQAQLAKRLASFERRFVV